MPARRLRPAAEARAAIDFDGVRAALDVPVGFPPAVLAEAAAAAADPPVPAVDRTDLPLVTVDPPGSMDLDQAMFLERITGATGRFRVHYAIADVASFVRPGGAVEAESRSRGQTLYSPDLATPLHPRELSEGAASLLPGVNRPAVLWTIDLDEQGEPVRVELDRALVRSTVKFDYAGVQADADADRLHPSLALLPEIGELRRRAARSRHAISLDLPDAEIVRGADQHWTLRLRALGAIEDYNAEISLLTGMCAARIMLDGGVGLLRTLPAPGREAVAALRRSAAALGVSWPAGAAPGDVIAAVDGGTAAGAAFLEDAVRLLRGAGYTPVTGSSPEQLFHAGVGAPYAHVTAPLRRLVDRFGTEVCLALHQRRPVPDWVAAALSELPALMAGSDRRAGELERACTWAVTAFLLSGREGEEFSGTVVQLDAPRDRATVLLADPPVRARSAADGLTEGSAELVRLVGLDEAARSVDVAVARGGTRAADDRVAG